MLTATKFALRSLARRDEALEEISELEAHLDRLVAQVAPELFSWPGLGTRHAATLLVVAGDNPNAWTPKPLSPASAGSLPSRLRPGRW